MLKSCVQWWDLESELHMVFHFLYLKSKSAKCDEKEDSLRMSFICSTLLVVDDLGFVWD